MSSPDFPTSAAVAVVRKVYQTKSVLKICITKFSKRNIPKPWMNYTLRLYLNIITYKFYKNSVHIKYEVYKKYATSSTRNLPYVLHEL